MARRKTAQREREAIAEPMESQQASEYQHVAETLRARIWEMHLRGIPKTRIAAEFSLARATVARVISACYAEVADEHKQQTARKLGEAVQRMRLVQEQAWNDHDADDERERQVLALSIAQATPQAADASDDSDAKSRHNSAPSAVSIRYQSQRSQYLRIILDAEKEIARLEGLYEGLLDVDAGIAVTFIKLTDDEVQRHRARQNAQGGLLASSATLAAIPAPGSELASDGGGSGG